MGSAFYTSFQRFQEADDFQAEKRLFFHSVLRRLLYRNSKTAFRLRFVC
jgi:hypothetical protein